MVREYKAPSNGYWELDDRSGEYVVIYPNGTKRWYKNGKRHREDGPAQEWYYVLKNIGTKTNTIRKSNQMKNGKNFLN